MTSVINIGKISSDFIWQMEDVLDHYEQPYDPSRPVLCFDERPCQLIADSIVPLPIKPRRTKKKHYEYIRNVTCCIFIAFEPRAGKRLTYISKQRTKVDYANFMKMIADNYPDARSIVLVQDNLNTHTAGCFYEAFSPDEAFRFAQRFEFHYTPKKGSWLNMAEIELFSALKAMLRSRIGSLRMLADEVHAWEQERNAIRANVKWQFNKEIARTKFQRHYINIKINVMQH